MKNCSFDEYKLLKYKMSKDELKRKPWVAFQIANLMLFYVILSIRNFIRQPIISLIISNCVTNFLSPKQIVLWQYLETYC